MQWNADLYDSNHGFVSTHGAGLMVLLDAKKNETILDLGCGTGSLTNEIRNKCRYVMGIDNSQEMIDKAKQNFPDLDFVCADARTFSLDMSFDAVFSNAVLHWIPQKELVLKNIYNHLNSQGRFVAEFGGKDNNQMMLHAFRTVLIKHGYSDNASIDFWYYPAIGEYATAMEEAGFRVTFAAHFDRQTKLEGENGIVNWFKMFGGNLFRGIPQNEVEDILKETQDHLYNSHYINGSWFADYMRIRVVGIK